MAEKLLVATKTFWAFHDGKRTLVTKGKTRVRADHPLVKGREHKFKDADSQFDDVEDTMARPGRRRGTQTTRQDSGSGSAPAKKATKKAPAKKSAAKKTAAKKD